MFDSFSARCLGLLLGTGAALASCSTSDREAPNGVGGSSGHGGAGASAVGGIGAAGGIGGAALGSGAAGRSGGGAPVTGSEAGAASEAGAPSGAFWKPDAGTSWQWQLTDSIDTTVDVDVMDIDGFDSDAELVEALHAQGKKVICYLSVGSYEDWRPDAAAFSAEILGKEYPGWPGERFVDIRAKALRDIIEARIDLCQRKGFDGVEPDNMDVYAADSGFPLTRKDGIEYANWLASVAHARGLNIGQKNASELANELEPVFDWVLTEDCYDQGWCAEVAVYVDNDKPVFMSEYTDTGVDFAAACSWGKPRKFSPILKGRDLDAAVEFCP